MSATREKDLEDIRKIVRAEVREAILDAMKSMREAFKAIREATESG